jgi:hypothetical protein
MLLEAQAKLDDSDMRQDSGGSCYGLWYILSSSSAFKWDAILVTSNSQNVFKNQQLQYKLGVQ